MILVFGSLLNNKLINENNTVNRKSVNTRETVIHGDFDSDEQAIIVKRAASVLQQGGVIAYPTEYCFGLGCDPRNITAVQRIITIKQRKASQGLILLAGNSDQVSEYSDINALSLKSQILESWPGPVTWTLPARQGVSQWLRGTHPSIAMRITAHQLCVQLCLEFGHAIVSTSANRHNEAALLNAVEVVAEMGDEVDYVLPADVGGASKASQIRDGLSGEILR